MKHQVKVPSAGESVAEAYIGGWRKQSGDVVKKGEIIVDLESQKATFELEAEVSGRLEIVKPTVGSKVAIGEVIATIDDAVTQSGVVASEAKQSPSTPAPAQPTSIAQLGPAARRGLVTPRTGDLRIAPITTSATPSKSTAFHYTADAARGEKAT
ncbi:MAG: hypothetical protein HY465_00145, partial [Deltaproteobacteria bacterium]|nr:hypothetical protein [Deltaproteobacteria bacterium]